MYFSRMMLNPLANRQRLAESFCRDAYREHQALWGLFDNDPDAQRDFLYRQMTEGGRIKYYVVSERLPIDEKGIWLIEPPKQYKPKLSVGQKLFFMLRANPVVTVSDADGKRLRHDVVMHEKKRIDYKKMPKSERPALQTLVQDSGVHWLQKRADRSGFEFQADQVAVDGYSHHSGTSKKHRVRYSTLDFNGRLTVTDVERFTKTLYQGLGKSKAFGCGLMLIRPG